MQEQLQRLFDQWQTALHRVERAMEAPTGAVLTVNGKQIAAYSYHAALRGVQATYQDMLASLRSVLEGESTLQEMVDDYEDSRRIAPSVDWMEEGPFKTSQEISRYCEDEEMKEIYKLLPSRKQVPQGKDVSTNDN